MSQCHRCGSTLPEGALKYQVALRVSSMFDGIITEAEWSGTEPNLAQLLEELEQCDEEDLNRQIYEDDVFIMCPACKEAFMEDVYAHLITHSAPEFGRDHLIH
jgi:hypothetical protein